uniref:Protochlorophyllide reductase ChlB subunit n=1 Tax=Glaucosphaera vacuolata TaxID=38265 RepID=UPI001FCE22E1|nr:Protochlorophyllide reductase ChlB subunit [Glaucosphaera vacuolata]UNJ18598.1 Protochlorophyllide reductase ChlB subunit [Glaucosphaera vacuolata]
MKLAYWMYAGPAHIGTLRIASSFVKVHAIMHAPLGDDYFNVMKSMLERERNFTPVTTSIVDRNVLSRGSQEKVINNIKQRDAEEKPDLIILTPTCTSSILQEDLQNFVIRAAQETSSDVLLADVNHYRINELQAADRTLKQIIEFYINKAKEKRTLNNIKTPYPSLNIIGAVSLGFHVQHDITELKKIFHDLNLHINLIVAEGISVRDLEKLPQAWFNFIPYREIGVLTAEYLRKELNMPYINTAPFGIIQTAECLREIATLINNLNSSTLVNYEDYIDVQTRFISQSAWFSRSIDCQNLIGKTAVVFGDATHSAAITKILAQELGIIVLWAGTYCQTDEAWFNEQVKDWCHQVIVNDNHGTIAKLIFEYKPDAIFGTQMERHIGKKLNIPCGVISSPVHIQNFPLGYRPFLGYEGSNQIIDLIYNSFTLGMEDHLLEMFEGHDPENIIINQSNITWSPEAQKELKQIPGFVREKIKMKIERFAEQKSIYEITPEIMYIAKENS